MYFNFSFFLVSEHVDYEVLFFLNLRIINSNRKVIFLFKGLLLISIFHIFLSMIVKT